MAGLSSSYGYQPAKITANYYNKTTTKPLNAAGIKTYQTWLRNMGYQITADGIAGAKTRAAVADFQKKYGSKVGGLTSDGNLSAKTQEALRKANNSHWRTEPWRPVTVTTKPNKTVYSKPSGTAPTSPGGSPGSNIDYGASISGNTSIPSGRTGTVDVWHQTPIEDLIKQATTATNAIYDPQIQGLLQKLRDQQQNLAGGRLDIQGDYARQIADLAQLMQNSKAYQEGNTAATNQLFEQARGAMGASQEQAGQNIEAGYRQSTDALAGLAGQLGISQWASPSQTAMNRDKLFAQQMLGTAGGFNQANLANQQVVGSNMSNILASGLESQKNLQTGQFGLARDAALKQIDQQVSAAVSEIQGDLSMTQSEKQSKLYELLKSLQESDWSKYMETAELNFNQGIESDKLGQSAAEIQIKQSEAIAAMMEAQKKSAADSSSLLTNPMLGRNYLTSAISGMTPENQSRMLQVYGILTNPWTPSNPMEAGSNPFGAHWTAGQQFYGPTSGGERENAANYYARAYSSLKGSGLVSGTNDPNWQVMQNAIDMMFGGAKTYKGL